MKNVLKSIRRNIVKNIEEKRIYIRENIIKKIKKIIENIIQPIV